MPRSCDTASAGGAAAAAMGGALRGDACPPGVGAASARGFGAIADGFNTARATSDASGAPLSSNDVLAEPLLSAVLGFLAVFDALGSTVLTRIVASDFRSKVAAARSALARECCASVRELVRAEVARPPRMFDHSGTEALRWARRIILFVDALVERLLVDARAELRAAAADAYRATLAVNHPTITRSIFENALTLLPDRAVFLDNLYSAAAAAARGRADLGADAIATMHAFRVSAAPHIAALNAIFADDCAAAE